MKFLLNAVLMLSLCLLTKTVQGQTDSLFTQAEALRESGKLNEALTLYYQYQQQTRGSITTRDEASLSYKIAACYFNLSDYDSTVKYMKYALTQKEKILDRSDTFLLSAHAVMGYIYRYEKPDIRKAASHFDDQRSIMDAYPDRFSDRQKFRNYYSLASANRELNDYDRALNYAYKALSIAQTITNEPQLAENCYLVIANSLTGKKLYEKANDFFLKKLTLNIKQRGNQHESLALDYYNIAINDNDRNRPNDAIFHFQKAKEIASKHDDSLLPDIYRELGVSYRLTGQKDQSFISLNKALSFESSSPLNTAWTYRQIADYYNEEQEFDSAYNNYQKGLRSLIPEFSINTTTDNPSLTSLKVSNPFVYTLLALKAACLLNKYKVIQSDSLLQQAQNTYSLMDQLTDSYRKNLILESSRIFFQQQNYEVYQKAMDVQYQLYLLHGGQDYIENCWRLIERNKSILLLENLLQAERESGMKLPDSTIEIRRKISASILKAQKDLMSCESAKNCQESQLISLRQSISSSEDKLRQQEIEVKEQFTNYYNFAEDGAILNIKKLQSDLAANQAMISYFESDEFFYVVTINNTKASLDRIPRDQYLSKTLNDFLSEISGETLKTNGIKKSFDTFSKTAHALYEKIIPESVKKGNFNDLIIIPDGQLAGVPFEALVQDETKSGTRDFSQLSYLIKDYSINYGFSATLWHKNRMKEVLKNPRDLIAFGTSNSSRPELANLNAVKEEMTHLNRLSNSRVFSDAQATEINFKAEAVSAGMIHLALHNINDYENPLNSQLVFSSDSTAKDSGLFLYELFNVQMDPSLVVLSGCETGIGKWLKGEGAYHMGRGFLYHGNPAMIMSLWKVRDASTARIMASFYSELQNSNSSESIRNAKLSFLDSADPLTAHPSNWAAFIGIGQVSLPKPQSNILWIWLLPIFLLLLVIKKAVRKHKAHQTAH